MFANLTSILAVVVYKKMAKTATGFFCLEELRTIVNKMIFLLIVRASKIAFVIILFLFFSLV